MDLSEIRQERQALVEKSAAHAELWERLSGQLDADGDCGNEEGGDQDPVLDDLRPGDPLHAAEGRVGEDDRHSDHDPDGDVHLEETREDDADAAHLSRDVGEAHEDRAHDRDDARDVRLVAISDEVRNSVVAELAEIGGQQQGEQHVATRPAHEVHPARVAHGRDEPRHGDEGGGTHPVGGRRHAVGDGRHAAACDVEAARVPDAAQPGDGQVGDEGHAHEHEGPELEAHDAPPAAGAELLRIASSSR